MNYYHFHIGDYLVDTAHLSILEDGAYRRLMDRYYTTELPLSKDESALFRVVRARSEEEKEAVRVVLAEFFTLSEDGWKHKRCDSEIAAYQAKAEVNRANGAKGGRPKGEDVKPKENPQETLTNNQEPITNNQEENKKETARERADIFTLETITGCGVSPQVAVDFISHRKRKKAPLTATAWERLKKDIAKAEISLSEGLEICMARGWTGFDSSWITQNKASPKVQPLSSAGMKTAAAAQRFVEKMGGAT